jgi:hypothetical protein
MLVNERLQLSDEPTVAAERKLGLDPALEDREPLPLEAGDLRLRPVGVTKLGEWSATPETECLGECARGRGRPGATPRQRPPAPLGKLLQAVDVDASGLDVERVSTLDRAQAPVAKGLAEWREVRVQAPQRARRRPRPP